MLILLIFVAFFVAVALILFSFGAPRAQEMKEARSRLSLLRGANSIPGSETAVLRRVDRLSNIPWLNAVLTPLQFTGRLKLLLEQADVSWTVGRFLLLSASAALAAGVAASLRTGALPITLLMAVLAGCAPLAYVLHSRSSRFRRMRQHLPEALDHMSSAIRAGHSFSSAMGMAARESPEPVRREFRQCFDEQNFGLELRFALLNLARRVPIHDIRIMVTAVMIQNETGGNLTEILDKVGHLIRQDFQLQRQVDIHTVQGRMTGWILSLLPVVLGILLYLVNPKNMSLLWTRAEGRKLMLAGGIMTLVGAFIIRKVIRIRV